MWRRVDDHELVGGPTLLTWGLKGRGYSQRKAGGMGGSSGQRDLNRENSSPCRCGLGRRRAPGLGQQEAPEAENRSLGKQGRKAASLELLAVNPPRSLGRDTRPDTLGRTPCDLPGENQAKQTANPLLISEAHNSDTCTITNVQ